MRERRLPAVNARPNRPLAMPSWSQRRWPRIRRMMAAQPPATTAGPKPNGMISAPLPERAQPFPESRERLSTIVRTQRTMPAITPASAMSPANLGSRLGSLIDPAIHSMLQRCHRALLHWLDLSKPTFGSELVYSQCRRSGSTVAWPQALIGIPIPLKLLAGPQPLHLAA